MNLKKFFSCVTIIYCSSCTFCFFSLSAVGLKNNDENQIEFSNDNHKSSFGKISLNLDKAMDMGEKASYLAKMAIADYKALTFSQDAVLRKAYPSVSIDANRYIFSSSVNKATGVKFNGLKLYPKVSSEVGVTVVQPIGSLFEIFALVKASSAFVKVAIENAKQSKVDARFNAATAFINFKKGSQLVKVAQASVESTEKQFENAKALDLVGKIARADLLKFQLSLANALTNLAMAKETYEVTKIILAESIGLSNPELIEIDQNDDSFFQQPFNKTLDQNTLLEMAFENRYDFASANHSVNAAKYSKIVQMTNYVPKVDFVMSYTRDLDVQSINTSPVTIPATSYSSAVTLSPGYNYSKSDIQDRFLFGLKLNWTIWDWGVRQANIDEKIAEESKAKVALDYKKSMIRIEVQKALLHLKFSLQNIESAKTSLTLAEEAYTRSNARFETGKETAADLIGAESDQTRARGNLEDAKGDLILSWLSLFKTIGLPLELKQGAL
ncbi:MAG: TolC family protein [Silvanigrellaceae bacterium]|nr:TolC family protein [Silvanigrellaceae bacterium]